MLFFPSVLGVEKTALDTLQAKASNSRTVEETVLSASSSDCSSCLRVLQVDDRNGKVQRLLVHGRRDHANALTLQTRAI